MVAVHTERTRTRAITSPSNSMDRSFIHGTAPSSRSSRTIRKYTTNATAPTAALDEAQMSDLAPKTSRPQQAVSNRLERRRVRLAEADAETRPER